jgi:hypothetical protein
MPRKFERKLVLQLVVDHPDLSPAELEGILLIRPDECWSRGENYKPSPHAKERQYQFSRWALREIAPSLDDLPETVRVLLNRVEECSGKFLNLPDDSRVALTLFVDETQTVIGTGFDWDVIQFLAKIRAEIDVSLVVHRA